MVSANDLVHQVRSDYVPTTNMSGAVLTRRADWEIGLNTTVLILLFLISMVGNTLVVAAIKTKAQLQEQVSNLFIINLCCTDITLGLFVMATSVVTMVMDVTEVPWLWCDVCCAVNYICIIVSMFTLAAISIERYIAVVHTLKYPLIVQKRRICLVIAYAWVQGFGFAVAPTIMQWVHYDYWEGVCAIDWHQEKQQAMYYVIVAFIVCFIMPGIVMLFCYTRIMISAKKLFSSTVTPNICHEAVKAQVQTAAKTIRSLLVVVLFFFLCMTPFCITKLLKVLNEDADFVPHYANLSAAFFQYTASCINPFIYGIFRPDFRAAYKLMFCRPGTAPRL